MIQRLSNGRPRQSTIAESGERSSYSLFSGSLLGFQIADLRKSLGPFAIAAVFCFGGAILFNCIFPEFLLHHHDGMHAYALLQTLHDWSQFYSWRNGHSDRGYDDVQLSTELVFNAPSMALPFSPRPKRPDFLNIRLLRGNSLCQLLLCVSRSNGAAAAFHRSFVADSSVLDDATAHANCGLLGLIVYFVVITLGLFGRSALWTPCARGIWSSAASNRPNTSSTKRPCRSSQADGHYVHDIKLRLFRHSKFCCQVTGRAMCESEQGSRRRAPWPGRTMSRSSRPLVLSFRFRSTPQSTGSPRPFGVYGRAAAEKEIS